MKTKRLAADAVLTSVALIIFIIELQIPTLVPIPGVKLGLANIVTVFAIFLIGYSDAAFILFARIIIGGFFSGQLTALIYSLAGGILCYIAMILMKKIVTEKQIWVCSIIGAAAHNIGQIIAAVLLTGTPSLIIYLPVLMVSGIIAGTFTGLCAQFAVSHFRQIFPDFIKQNKKSTKSIFK